VRLTAIHYGLRDDSNCGVRVVTTRGRNGFACATVTVNETRQGGNRLVPDLCVVIRGQNLREIGYNVGNTNILVTTPLTGETV
jgi:hypothetical protein